MDRAQALATLKARETEIRQLGIARLSLFGSTARNQAGPASDLDLAVSFDETARIGLFRYVKIIDELETMLGASVDLVTEPTRKPRLQAEIDRDRVRVF